MSGEDDKDKAVNNGKKNDFDEPDDEATKKELAEEFVEIMEAKLKRSEKHVWFIKDHERTNQDE